MSDLQRREVTADQFAVIAGCADWSDGARVWVVVWDGAAPSKILFTVAECADAGGGDV
jgi:hypothetical protein